MHLVSEPRIRLQVIGLLTIALTGLPAAYGGESRELLQGHAVVDKETLAGVRGGFFDNDGIKIAFSFASEVRINGQLQSQTSIRIPDMAMIASALKEGSMISVTQNGPGNTIAPEVLQNATAYIDIIQNTVDRTIIQHSRSLDLQIQGVEDLRGLNTSALIDRGILDSLR